MHIPVLKNEILKAFRYLKDKDGYFVDATIGAGGHSLAIAAKYKIQNTKYKILGIDKDQIALDLAKQNIRREGLADNFILIHDDFKNIEEILKQVQDDNKIDDLKISGALIDLGVSSMQLDDKERGFSFTNLKAKLDMRMDQSQDLSAFDVVNYYPAEKLERIFRDFGEERFYKTIAKNICKARKVKPIEKVGDLLAVLEQSIPSKVIATSKKHFATNVFRALRIEVNQELADLNKALFNFIDVLEVGAKLAVISFHSTEDRIVKETFRKAENPCICPPLAPVCTCGKKPLVKILTKKPIVPSDEEIKINFRARSAKLRVIERLAP